MTLNSADRVVRSDPDYGPTPAGTPADGGGGTVTSGMLSLSLASADSGQDRDGSRSAGHDARYAGGGDDDSSGANSGSMSDAEVRLPVYFVWRITDEIYRGVRTMRFGNFRVPPPEKSSVGSGRVVALRNRSLACRFAQPRIHIIPDSLRRSVPLFLR